jgi:hypothetical protein
MVWIGLVRAQYYWRMMLANVKAQAMAAALCGRSPGAQGWAWMHDCKT